MTRVNYSRKPRYRDTLADMKKLRFNHYWGARVKEADAGKYCHDDSILKPLYQRE